jgi:hypothetical protein
VISIRSLHPLCVVPVYVYVYINAISHGLFFLSRLKINHMIGWQFVHLFLELARSRTILARKSRHKKDCSDRQAWTGDQTRQDGFDLTAITR